VAACKILFQTGSWFLTECMSKLVFRRKLEQNGANIWVFFEILE